MHRYAFFKSLIVYLSFYSSILYSQFSPPEMVDVYGGVFLAGNTPEQMNNNYQSSPPHKVEIWDYKIGKYEVTQELYLSVMGDNPGNINNNPGYFSAQKPVTNIDYFAAVIFCN